MTGSDHGVQWGWVLRRMAVALSLLAVAGMAALWQLRRRQEHLGPDGVVESSDTQRSGTVADRGKGGRFAIDLERLRQQDDELDPTVEYLTYIQSRRGTTEHLLFVRHEDLDAIAALEGQEPMTFLERLQHLGVVISKN